MAPADARERGRTRERVRDERVYDDFHAPRLDAGRWTIVEVPDAAGRPTRYEDRNARVRSGGGWLEVTVDPFTRFHDTDPARNNAKQLYRSTERILAPADGTITVDACMAVRTYRQVPYDLQDAYGSVSLIDLATGMVLLFAATNDTLYGVCERLGMPGVDAAERFRHRVVFDIATRPGSEHRYSLTYCRGTRRATWRVDGQPTYWTRLDVDVEGFHLGMGLLSSRDLRRYPRAEREHGQGATGRWAPWRLLTVTTGPREPSRACAPAPR